MATTVDPNSPAPKTESLPYPEPSAGTYVERHVFSKLTPEKRAALTDEFAKWGLDIFHTTSDTLRGYWGEKKSFETVVYQLRSKEGGRLVGNTTIKFYKIDFEGEDSIVVKLGLGVHPKFRGNKFALRCLMYELIRTKAKYPRTPLYLFSTLIHPVTYKLCCDLLTDQLYPYYKNPENPRSQRMIEHLAGIFNVKKADSPHPYVYREGFSAKETEEATEYWLNDQRPEVRFFIDKCPTYYKTDDCLIMFAPLNFGHLIKNMLGTLARNKMDQKRGKKHKFKTS